MGWNTVAVLYNDHLGEIEQSSPLGQRIAHAIRQFSPNAETYQFKGYFGVGEVVSTAHADNDQIVIVGKNTGRRIQDCEGLEYYTLLQLAECLKRHGWSAKPPGRVKLNQHADKAKQQPEK